MSKLSNLEVGVMQNGLPSEMKWRSISHYQYIKIYTLTPALSHRERVYLVSPRPVGEGERVYLVSPRPVGEGRGVRVI